MPTCHHRGTSENPMPHAQFRQELVRPLLPYFGRSCIVHPYPTRRSCSQPTLTGNSSARTFSSRSQNHLFVSSPPTLTRALTASALGISSCERAWDFIVPLLKTGSTLLLADFNSPEVSQSRARLQSLVAANVARDFFPTSATFRRGALVESILDGSLVSSQITYALEAHTVDLVTDHGHVKISGFPLPCFDKLDRRLKMSLQYHEEQSTSNTSLSWLAIAPSRTSTTPLAQRCKTGSG